MRRYRLVSLAFMLFAASLFGDTPPAGTLPDTSKPADPEVTFRSDVSLLRVDAQVVDAQNRPITGLKVEDFVLREGGKQQEIRNFVSEKMPVDVLLLLDVSRSMEPHVERVASAAHQALRVLGDQDRVAIMVFDRGTRVRLPFRNRRQDVERELEQILDEETFDGGTDITRGLLDAANYMAQNGRRDARRAIVILTDDQTERDRDDAAVLRALTRADSVLSALIAPDALHTGSSARVPRDGAAQSWLGDDRLEELWRRMMPRGLDPFRGGSGGSAPWIIGPRTRSAGTSRIASQSGGDSITVEDASAFEETLARIRERYGLYFYLPEDAKPGDERTIQVELSEAARSRYPGAEVRYRRSYLAPNGSTDSNGSGESDDPGPTRVSLPPANAPDSRSAAVLSI
jgi:VWFA-related protein